MTTASSESQASPGKRIAAWLWNPFTHTAGPASLGIGLAILLATSAIGALSNTHFDGILDTHTGRAAPLWFFLGEGIVNWLSLAIVLWIAGLILTPKDRSFRAVDLFGTQALARWPFLLVALVCLLPGYTRYTEALMKSAQAIQGGQFAFPEAPLSDLLTFWGSVGVMLLCLVWFVALAWKSFRISCDAQGHKAVIAFVIAIFLAEAISKVVIMLGIGLVG